MQCPLTAWENQLRELAGQAYDGSATFMGRLIHDTLFYPDTPQIAFTVMHLAFLVLVVQAAIMYPPRWFRFGKKKEVVAETPKVAVAESRLATKRLKETQKEGKEQSLN